MENSKCENYIVHVLDKGFLKAAQSFGVMIRRSVKGVTSATITREKDLCQIPAEKKKNDLVILTTKIIGEISGKSYLILTREEAELVAESSRHAYNQQLRDAFLLEIDNVVSASVISEFSNAFNVEVYGDVPQLIKLNSSQISAYVSAELNGEGSCNAITSNSVFQFDDKSIRPVFIWRLNKKIFDLITPQLLVA